MSVRLTLHDRGGFTLIEAAAALAICSAMVVVLLGVRSRLLHQAERAQRVSAANVVAGQLAADWRLGRLNVPPGERRSGRDEASDLRWELDCDHQETKQGIFLNRLEVRVFALDPDRPVIAFEAWRPLGGYP